MKHNESVARIMSKNPTTVHTANKMSEVRGLLTENSHIHHLPVVSGKKVVGMISSSDLLRLSYGGFGNEDTAGWDAMLDHQYKIEEVMQKDVATLDIHKSVRDAAQLLSEGRFHALPITDGGELVGIVTTTDIMRYLVENL